MRILGLFLGIFLMSLLSSVQAQVTVGSNEPPEKAAILDVKSKNGGEGLVSAETGGFLLPRVAIDTTSNISVFPGITENITSDAEKKRHKGLTVYNITSNHAKNLEEGIYVWNGVKWEKAALPKRVNFFYMPSIVIDTSSTTDKPPIDLYGEYRKQFEQPRIKNDSAPDEIPFFLNRTELYYYITDFDDSVFDKDNMSITNDGYFHYKVKSPAVDGSSFINIVFVIK
jgi:hypothetical protein